MEKVLLTGAAGSIGYETLKQLYEAGYDVNVIELPSKKNKKKLKKWEDRVNIFYGSINDKELVKNAIHGVDVVIHLAAIIPPLADEQPELTRTVNFYGTKNIVDAMKEESNSIFLLYSSSVSVYGDRVLDPWIQVGDPLNPSEGDYYALTKIETEKMIQESKIDYSIFRLTGIMGRPQTDPLMFHMPLDTKLEIASIEDTATAFVNAIPVRKKLNHKIFNLGGGEKCRTTYRDFLFHMFDIYGLNKKYVKEEAFAQKNFHCGYYLDGDKLENLVHFQHDTLDTYYQRVKDNTNPTIKLLSKVFSRPILYTLTHKSEPMIARKKQDKNLIERFFKM